jgi:hypothetical protein
MVYKLDMCYKNSGLSFNTYLSYYTQYIYLG